MGLLRELILERLPEGPPLYPPGDLTDLALEDQLAELVREQALHVTRQEVPHSIAVVIEDLEHAPDLTTVHATLVVERDSQKGIVIGKGGETLKTIGTAARQEMERLLGTKVYLDLRVEVRRKWRRDERALREFGLYTTS